MSAYQIAVIANYPHPWITYSTAQQLAALGYQVVTTPTRSNPLHSTILLPRGVAGLSDAQAAALSMLFFPNRLANPTFAPP